MLMKLEVESQNLQETSPGPLLGLWDSVDSRPHHLQGWQLSVSRFAIDSNFPGHGHLLKYGASAGVTAGLPGNKGPLLRYTHAPRGLRASRTSNMALSFHSQENRVQDRKKSNTVIFCTLGTIPMLPHFTLATVLL